MKKPNIIMLLSDDQGAWALGCSGNKEIHTPNIDRLAAEGVRFENFFCASPVCSPARASLLTGQIPSQHGVHDWICAENRKQEEIEYLKGQRAYTDILSENGYICGLSGKWHLGNSAVPQHGFSHWFAHKAGGGPYYGAPLYKNGELYEEPRYLTDVITDDAVEFLEEASAGDAPFYLHVGYTAPHSPWLKSHPQKYVDMYKDCPFDSCPQEPRHPDAGILTDWVQSDIHGNLCGYYASITAMDENIGRILNKLDELGIRENTLIFFCSDNGFSCGQHGFWGKGNGTFPLNMYESSVKVPLIASMPGNIPQNTVCKSLLSAYDFMPTLLDYLDYVNPDSDRLPGKSFANVLRGKEFKQDNTVVVMDEYGPNRMIRSEEFKYVKRYPYGPDEMYNLKEDPEERNNLLVTGEYEEKACELRKKLSDWFAKYVNPDIDAAKEAVNGSGQMGLAGSWGNGEIVYRTHDVKNHPNYHQYKAK